LAALSPFHTLRALMPDLSLDPELNELVEYLSRSSRLSQSEAQRLIDEVFNFLNELPEDFVRRRHWALQTQGLSNSEIFVQLASELRTRRFRAPEYTERQIRRMIYG
jgi:hypothetical protein